MAALTRYRPFQPARSLQREIDRMFGEYLPFLGDEDVEPGLWAPVMDLTETEKEYVVKMDVPGIPKEAVTVNLEDHRLIVRGERKEEEKKESANQLVVERRYGNFYRSMALPKAASEDGIAAEMQDGVLTIKIKKVEEAKPRRIEIK